jgi:ribosomal-protein-alanine N-acetyltransferase
MSHESEIKKEDISPLSQAPSFRLMRESDLDAVADLANRSFPGAWSRADLRNEVLANHFSFPYVVVLDDTVAGYAIVRCVAGEAELMTLVIDSRLRRQRLGWSLLAHVAGEVKKQGALVIHLEVRRSNTAARNLYSKFGFEEVGLRKNYYLKEMEDAILMRINPGEVPLDGLV